MKKLRPTAVLRFSKDRLELDLTSQPRRTSPLLDAVSPNTPFYYSITQLLNGEIVRGEVGVGIIKGVRSKYILERTIKHCSYEKRGSILVSLDEVDFSGFGELLVSYEPPQSYVDALYVEHAVLCSMGANAPTAIPLEENSVLGRLNGYIQSIDMGELTGMIADKVIEALEKKAGGLRATSLTLIPGNRPESPKRGTLSYNLERNCLEIFTGGDWKGLGETP